MHRARGQSRVVVIVIVAILVLAAAAAWAWSQVKPPDGGPYIVIIPEGTDATSAGQRLQDAGVIRSAQFLTWIIDRRGSPVLPGRYVFSTGLYPWTAARFLAKGVPPDPEVEITIPEGKRLPEIAAILDAAGICPAEAILDHARDPALARELTGQDVPSLEGYLFPDTYKFKPHEDAANVVRRLFERFTRQSAGLERPGMSRHEFVTLASIVEREARVAAERPVIAAVFLRRLAMGMRLEADPTVRYALNRWDTAPVLYVDLEVASPYNTYRSFGLPPGPIAAPGRSSLEAVAHPEDTDVLFFVARANGSHAFSRTFAEHQANIAAFR